jgi:hypothetical protein
MPNKPTTLRELKKEFMDKFPNEVIVNGYTKLVAQNAQQISEWWLSKIDSHNTELLQKIEGIKQQCISGDICRDCPHDHRIEVLDEVISLINQEK